ncbi:acyl carrier protein [Dietzia sp. NCCP-2495]|uniref:acyl carrier protein n=1 Tax=Dietzia sp. NCCP-2495 TaxID=2934675 RepID=UPI002230E917|nr:acyl carrier protein [Dietzia sp. NCCP-2495]
MDRDRHHNSSSGGSMPDHIESALQDILTEDLDLLLDQASSSSRLVEDLGLDSVGFAIGVVSIEERLGVRLSEREMLETSTVGELVDLVRSRRTEPADQPA